MKDIKLSHITPDGKEVIIRTATESDAENLLALKKSYLKNTTTLPLYEDEYTNTVEEEAQWIKKYIEQDNCLLLVAEHEGQLIGNLDLTGSHRKKMHHTGVIGMGVRPEWQNKKIGGLIMENTLKWAKKSPLEIVWLEVYSTNHAGRKMYENHGFEICGVIEYFFKEEIPADKITMVKYLE